MKKDGRRNPPSVPSSVSCLLSSAFCLLTPNLQPLFRRHFRARRIVGFQIANRVLDACEDRFEERRDRVVPLVMAVGLVEKTALTLSADPAERVVVVAARI